MAKSIIVIVAIISVNFLFAQQNKTIATEKTVSITNKGVAIEGSLLSGSTAQKLVIIIAGSGPTDRNGNSIAGINCNAYKLLAEELSKNNIASFRYDKRGIAKSSIKDFSEKNLLFDDYVNDAIAIYNYLKDSSGFKKIYFAGHSEGSLIGMIASERTKADGYISIAGAGRPINVIIAEQVTKQSPIIGKQTDSLLTVLKTKNKIDSVPPYLLSLLRPSIQPYMVSWMKYDPQSEIKNVKCSILILQGTCDIQVKTLDAQYLYDANKKAKLEIIEGMTHVLKNAEVNCSDKNLNTYHDPSLPLNTQFVKDIVSFIELN
jgi:hypothetical protein